MKPKEHLEKFIELMKEENPRMDAAIEFATHTQQHDCKFVGKPELASKINGLYSLFHHATDIVVKPIELIKHPNEAMRDFYIMCKFQEYQYKIQCRLIKEKDVRQPHIDGDWGINFSSFRYERKAVK